MGRNLSDESVLPRLEEVSKNFCDKCANEIIPTDMDFCSLLGALSLAIEEPSNPAAKRKRLFNLRLRVSYVYTTALLNQSDDNKLSILKELARTILDWMN